MKIAPLKICWFRFFLLSPLFFAFAACSTPDESMNEIEYPPTLKQARVDTQKGDYAGAETNARKYLTNPQDVYWHGHAYLILGEAREAAGKTDEALEAYKQAITQGAGFDRKVTVQALYRISWIYEKTLQYENLVIVLKDLERVLTEADYFIKHVENPSRLANAYYAMGVGVQALEQRNQVTSQMIATAQSKSPAMVKLQVARLYRSFVILRPKIPLDPLLLIPLTQKELLDVAEMAEMKVSNQGLAQLKELYTLQWKMLSQKKIFKKLEQRLDYNKQRLNELAQFVDQIQDIQASRRPAELVTNPQTVGEFFRFLSAIEKEVRSAVSALDMGVQKYPKNKGRGN